jgi:hypothetical protein
MKFTVNKVRESSCPRGIRSPKESKTVECAQPTSLNARGYAMRPGENGGPILALNSQYLPRNEVSAKESQSVVYIPFRRVGIVFVFVVGGKGGGDG